MYSKEQEDVNVKKHLGGRLKRSCKCIVYPSGGT